MHDLLNVIRQASMTAMDERELADIVYGTVTCVAPITVRIDQKLLLTREFLVLPRRFQEYINNSKAAPDAAGAEQPETLRKGDRLILLKKQGGQEYIIFDKIGGDAE